MDLGTRLRRKRRLARHSKPATLAPSVPPSAHAASLPPGDQPPPTELVLAPSAALGALAVEAAHYAEKARADETVRRYRLQWQRFEAWCRQQRVQALPAGPAVLVLYITERARTVQVSAIAQALAAVADRHVRAHLPDPTREPEVRATWTGICRDKGVAPRRRARPLSPEILRVALVSGELSLIAVRDRAVLLLGFAAARRRLEVVSLNVSDVERVEQGLRVVVRRSKTDQLGEGFAIGVRPGRDRVTCPVAAVEDWLSVSGVSEGPLFQSVRGNLVTGKRLNGKEVSRIVKRAVERAGLDPADYSGHSLRAGFATSAAKRRKSMHDIARQTGHKSMTQLDRYIREAGLFDDSPSEDIGL